MKMTKTKVFKRGKFYVVQLQDEQGKYKQVAKFETELDAKVFKRDLIKDREGSLKKVTQLTVIDAWKKYSDYKFNLWNKYDTLSESQSKMYLRHYEKFVSTFFPKTILLRELSNKDLANFFMTMIKQKVTFGVAKQVLYQFKGMYEWCINEGIIDRSTYNIEFFEIKNYPELMAHHKPSKKTPLFTMSQYDELYELIKPADKNNYNDVVNFVGVCFAMFTGARISEIRGIEWSKVNFSASRIRIDKQVLNSEQVVDRVKAEGSKRIIIIPSKLLKILIKFKDIQSKKIANPIWMLEHLTTQRPITDKSIREFLVSKLEIMGVAKRFKGSPFKSFRHTVSTAVVNQQAASPVLNDNVIKNQIGHRDIRTTRQIYGDHNDLYGRSKDDQVIKALDQALDFDKLN